MKVEVDRDVLVWLHKLLIWQTEAFQSWHARTDADLCSARLLWSWSPGPAFRLLAWAMRVHVIRHGAHIDELLIAEPGSPDLLVSQLPSDASPVSLGK